MATRKKTTKKSKKTPIAEILARADGPAAAPRSAPKKKRKKRAKTATRPSPAPKAPPKPETKPAPKLALKLETKPTPKPERAPKPGGPARASTGRKGNTSVIFEALAAVLAPYMHLFEAEMHPRMGYCLKTYGEWPSELYFAGVQWDGNGLFFHLFPLMKYPKLLDGTSAELAEHMDGKLSFRFETFEPELFAELASITARAYERLRKEGAFGHRQAG